MINDVDSTQRPSAHLLGAVAGHDIMTGQVESKVVGMGIVSTYTFHR